MTEHERESLLSAARKAVLAALPEAWIAYVYGSVARGDEWPGSDVDIGVLLPPGKGLSNKLELMHVLSSKIGRPVDLVNLRDAGLDLIREVLRHGKVLFTQHRADALAWEAERMTDYADFNPRRADILDLYLRQPLRTRS